MQFIPNDTEKNADALPMLGLAKEKHSLAQTSQRVPAQDTDSAGWVLLELLDRLRLAESILMKDARHAEGFTNLSAWHARKGSGILILQQTLGRGCRICSQGTVEAHAQPALPGAIIAILQLQ
eukprot:1157493-Pelagomonas_calceolata.AAC.5